MCYLDVIAPPSYDLINYSVFLLTIAVVILMVSTTVLVVVALLQEFRGRSRKKNEDTLNQDESRHDNAAPGSASITGPGAVWEKRN